MTGSLIILQPGHSVVTDLGRTKGPAYGLPVNGALDQYSAKAANILAGNEDNDPLLELTALDFRMRATTDLLIAVTGAPLDLTVGGRECPQWEPVSVRAGEVVAVRGIRTGLRAYIAVHGSFTVPSLLGSCAPDTVVGFGLKLVEGFRLETRKTTAPITQPYFGLPLFRLGLTKPVFTANPVIDVRTPAHVRSALPRRSGRGHRSPVPGGAAGPAPGTWRDGGLSGPGGGHEPLPGPPGASQARTHHHLQKDNRG
jgi:hypothetical protein